MGIGQKSAEKHLTSPTVREHEHSDRCEVLTKSEFMLINCMSFKWKCTWKYLYQRVMKSEWQMDSSDYFVTRNVLILQLT